MQVRLTILDGSMRGRTFEFDLPEGEEVRIGRDGQRCRVPLSADYRSVSRQHCALRSVLGRLRIRTNKENVVLVGDQVAWDDTLLPSGSVLQLGRHGPRVGVMVRYPRDAKDLKSTIAFRFDGGQAQGAAPELELQRQADALAGKVETQHRRAWLMRIGIGSVALVGAWFALQARADAAELRQAVLDDDQRRVVLGMIAREAEAVPDLAETAARVADSVYCVMERDDGRETPVGTAWVVDRERGLLATNAHVAEDFVENRTFLRSSGQGRDDVRVEAARLHPDYAAFGDQLERYCRAIEMSGDDGASRSMRGYDVALLVVGEAERERLAPDLPVVGSDEVGAVTPGAACATVGFPAEGIGFNPQRPQHKTHLGHVVALTDYFMAAADPQQALLVHTSLPVAGGASGSPLVDARGRVIGLISSANVVHSAEGRRIPLAGTTCAQRVDTLHELLDGRAGGEPRRAIWAENFRVAVANAKKTMEQILIESFERALDGRGVGVCVMSRDQVQLEWDAETGATIKTVEIRMPATGAYLCCVIADDVVDIDTTVWLPGGVRKEDRSPDWFPSVAFEVEKGDLVRITAFRQGNRPTGATILVLQERP